MKRLRILAAASLVTVTVAVAGCGGSGDSSSRQAADSFAIAQLQETNDGLLMPGRILTGCAAEPGNKWLCITYTASLVRTITPAVIELAETASDPHIDGHVWKLEPSGILEDSSATVPPVAYHDSPFRLRPLVSQDGPPPQGHRTDRLTFYYSSDKTLRNFTVSCGEANVCS